MSGLSEAVRVPGAEVEGGGSRCAGAFRCPEGEPEGAEPGLVDRGESCGPLFRLR